MFACGSSSLAGPEMHHGRTKVHALWFSLLELLPLATATGSKDFREFYRSTKRQK